MFTKEISIPAKGMLFGEYGVLSYWPALAVTFFQYQFKLKITISPLSSDIVSQHSDCSVRVKSSFFSNGVVEFNLVAAPSSSESQFFFQLLLPWQDELKGTSVVIEVLESFDPSLGFGSSSALIAGVSLLLQEFSQENNNKFLWEKVRASLVYIQGTGSGYDVGVQMAAASCASKKSQCWQYQNQQNTPVPIIKALPISENLLKNFGCFLKTGLYSNTKKALSAFQNSIKKEQYCSAQGNLSEQFIYNISLENLKYLMNQSVLLNETYSLFPNDEAFKLVLLKLKGLNFKSMGAGLGDCLWVLCDKSRLVKEHGFLEHDIAFSFDETEG